MAGLTVVRAFAPASVANFGVGFDILGAALDGPGDTVTARFSRRAGVRMVAIRGDGGRLPLDPTRNTAAVAAAAVLRAASRRGSRRGIELELDKGLPLASGLGSSAASAVAGAVAAAALFEIRDRMMLLHAVLEGEHAADGAWHGDNAFSSLLGGLVLVPTSDPRALRAPLVLPVPARLRLVLVHPDLELPTQEARAVLPREVTLARHVDQSAALAELVAAVFSADVRRIGRCVASDRIVEPARARLVAGHDAVISAMKAAGAYGSALAGAGPALMAISEEGDLPDAIGAAAVAAWKRIGIEATARVHSVSARGARLL
jgi:homoserine kinase